MTLRHALPATALVLALVSSAGRLAAADEPISAVDGTISLDGKPLSGGRIVFYLEDDQFVGAKIKGGTYRVSRVPEGTWRVGVEAEGIPARYASAEKTLLTVQIRGGKNTVDFNLKR